MLPKVYFSLRYNFTLLGSSRSSEQHVLVTSSDVGLETLGYFYFSVSQINPALIEKNTYFTGIPISSAMKTCE